MYQLNGLSIMYIALESIVIHTQTDFLMLKLWMMFVWINQYVSTETHVGRLKRPSAFTRLTAIIECLVSDVVILDSRNE